MRDINNYTVVRITQLLLESAREIAIDVNNAESAIASLEMSVQLMDRAAGHLTDLVLAINNVPEEKEGVFCRDWITDDLFEYTNGDITINECMKTFYEKLDELGREKSKAEQMEIQGIDIN